MNDVVLRVYKIMNPSALKDAEVTFANLEQAICNLQRVPCAKVTHMT